MSSAKAETAPKTVMQQAGYSVKNLMTPKQLTKYVMVFDITAKNDRSYQDSGKVGIAPALNNFTRQNTRRAEMLHKRHDDRDLDSDKADQLIYCRVSNEVPAFLIAVLHHSF